MCDNRKTVRRFHEPGDCHELTFSCYRGMPLLTNDEWMNDLAESVDRAMIGQSCRLVAYVFMPEHVHLLVQPTKADTRIDLLLKAAKRPFSSRVKRRLIDSGSPLLERLTVPERPGVETFRFWQEGGGYDRNIRRDRPWWGRSIIFTTIRFVVDSATCPAIGVGPGRRLLSG